jgi:hypothetical protein
MNDDDALAALLALLERDIAAGRGVQPIPADLEAMLRRVIKDSRVDLDAYLDGDVALDGP